MASREAFIVSADDRLQIYHIAPSWTRKAACGTWFGYLRQRLEGEGAEEWLQAQGYRLCKKCAKVREAEDCG